MLLKSGKAVLYANKVTQAMQKTLDETSRRRRIQSDYNKLHNKSPCSVSGRNVASLFEIVRGEEEEGLESLVSSVKWTHDFRKSAKGKAHGQNLGPTDKFFTQDSELHPFEGLTASQSSVLSDESNDFASEFTRSDSDQEAMPDGMEEHEHVRALRAMADEMPRSAGVYLWRTGPLATDEVLYVGKAKRLRDRVRSYFSGTVSPRVRVIVERARHIEYVVTPGGEHDALLLEARLIKTHGPR